MILQEPVKAAIWHCLENYDYENAIFLSERLYAEVNTDDSLYMLATSYYRNAQIDHAYHVLKDGSGASPQCRYLLAICAFDLQRFSEAESAILEGTEIDLNKGTFETLITEYGDQSPFVLFVLAKTFIKTERRSRAVDALKIALKLNPFLWSSFVELCNLGEKSNPQTIFQLSNIEDLAMCHGSVDHMKVQPTPVQESVPSITITPEQIPPELTLPRITINSKYYTPEERLLENPYCLSGISVLPISRAKSRLRSQIVSDVISPSFGVLPLDSPNNFFTTPLVSQNDQHKSLAKKVRAHMGNLINRKEPPLQNRTKPIFNINTIPVGTPMPGNNLQSNVRRSTRLFSSNSYSVKENNKSPNRNKFVTPKSPTRKTKRIPKCNLNKTNAENAKNRLEKEKSETVTSLESKIGAIQQNAEVQKQSAEGLMSLLRTLGQAYLNLSQFDCLGAINQLNDLAPQHYMTTWVYSIIGLAYFELAEYEYCAKFFEKIRSKEPYRIKYMDIYSTALWHLQKEVALSALSQDLIQLNKLSPITWCVSGNCFSLHKEHDTAIKFFQRAVQVDPNFTYAYTLLGHEYIMTEELDKAMSCFRNAIRIDPRHYNAWFGIGTIYSKQERFHLAEINYTRALSINPCSSVIMCHIGVVQHALKKTEKALSTFNTAIGSDNKNPLCKFHRGSIYFAVGRHAEALKELEELKEIVPKESLVYYLIGKVHKKLGNTDLALMHFSWATDLDPKGANSQIKEAFDPAAGRSTSDVSFEDYQSESNHSVQPQALFGDIPDDSDDSL